MNAQFQKYRPFIALGVLALLLIFILWWLGTFLSPESDSAQIKNLNNAFVEEVNAHDWDGVTSLLDVTPERREQWLASLPAEKDRILIKTWVNNSPINVPAGATAYELDVTIVAELDLVVTTRQLGSRKGTVFYVKKGDRWYIDPERTGPSFFIPLPPTKR